MCEFKVINQTDESQIAEDILILTYTENNELWNVVKQFAGVLIVDRTADGIIFGTEE